MVSTKSLHKLAELMRADPEADAAAKMVDDAADEIDRLQSFFAQTLPFLREAWEACFDGKQKKLLSAEERGMGRLLSQFREIADGKPQLPFGTVTSEDCDQRVTQAAAWAHRILGSPNELREPLRQWVQIGETCADGLDRANAEVDRLRADLGRSDRDALWSLLHEAAGWIKSYKLGEGDRLYERISAALDGENIG